MDDEAALSGRFWVVLQTVLRTPVMMGGTERCANRVIAAEPLAIE
jgi:hypothetical protein